MGPRDSQPRHAAMQGRRFQDLTKSDREAAGAVFDTRLPHAATNRPHQFNAVIRVPRKDAERRAFAPLSLAEPTGEEDRALE